MSNKKKKLMWIGDDIRMNSGISVSSRELIFGSVKYFDFINIAGALVHPDKGKIINMDAATAQITGVPDSKITLYPVDNYGNDEIIFSIIDREKPDALCFQTDPRFYYWLFMIERQIRNKIPMLYWTIWDACPFPRYNHAFYESCDVLMSISKQTYNITKWVLGPEKSFCREGFFDKDGKLIPFEISDSDIIKKQ